ncbi:hypothetical protein L226DRAFT_546923 [Lentinus tigrinus ALCF2SS1-7]|uniref:uncharacterized protein n=1 Tax=Lentinus tigrinus ALCF2SS1-7 TaxID=1328758 RepID=UPI001165DCCE|nr:hypothetical protein L226DRAFT_546923 [Lentinus tigrinus ALCF2SS1-7]
MKHWDIYARELMSLGFGHPLWHPEPSLQFGQIRLGDVGYLRKGRFRFLFNSMHSAEHPVNATKGVPSGFEEFKPPGNPVRRDRDEITQTELHSKSLQSLSIAATASAGGTSMSASIGLRYQCSEESGALLMLKQPGHKTSLDCGMHIRRYMRAHLTNWCDFANGGHLGIGLQEKDLIFVSGFVKTSVWATAAFQNNCSSGELLVTGGCFVPSASGEFRVSMSKGTIGSVFSNTGPRGRLSTLQAGSEAPTDSDQCIFLQYYKVKSRKLRLPAVMRAAAGPHEMEYGPDDDDSCDRPVGCAGSSTSSSDEDIDSFYPNYDPIDKLLDYILQV